MERLETTLSLDSDAQKNSLAFLPAAPEKVCFFDIETTGLSADVSSLYLIGAAVLRDGCLRLIQWFADDYVSEKEILISFAELLSSYQTVVHYNGASFDIPYLKKKFAAHKLPSPFDNIQSMDLMRELPKDKAFFHTSDRKLATMERLLDFRRNDTFTGKDCIRLYTEFMQKKYFRDARASELKGQLLLHNHDDIVGTILCGQLLSYRHGRTAYTGMKKCSEASGKSQILLHGRLIDGFYPCAVRYVDDTGIKEPFFYELADNAATIRISLYDGLLYHFFENYKDYFYLPQEDMAIHKSVGIYVDKEFRRQAGANNCYIKKKDTFFPVPAMEKEVWDSRFPENPPLFRETRRSRNAYIEEKKLEELSQDQLSLLFSAFFENSFR